MKESTKKTIAISVVGGFVGYMIGRATGPCPAVSAGRDAPDIPALQRISGDLVYMCDQIRPIALQLESALADDQEISTSEAYALWNQMRRLA